MRPPSLHDRRRPQGSHFAGSSAVVRPLLVAAAISVAATTASAAPQALATSGTVLAVEGSFVGSFAAGDPIDGAYVCDTDEANASSADTTPSTFPGHEYTSYYVFPVPPYGGSLEFPQIPASFTGTDFAIVVSDDLALTAEETGGLLPAGTYDLVELNATDTSDLCSEPGAGCAPGENRPGDGQEWTLAILSDPTWFSDGSVIPNEIPAGSTTFLVTIQFDAAGNEVEAVFASAAVAETAAVPALGGGQLSVLLLALLGAALGMLRSQGAALPSRFAREPATSGSFARSRGQR